MSYKRTANEVVLNRSDLVSPQLFLCTWVATKRQWIRKRYQLPQYLSWKISQRNFLRSIANSPPFNRTKVISNFGLSLHSELECKFLLRGYYLGDKLLRKLLLFIRYFIILFAEGQYIMFCESLCRVSSVPQIFTTLFVDASRLQYICTKVVIEVRKWKRSCEIVSAMF